ncbi:MAG TPA: tripartite tricarboxylate transporter TctB family protein [Thermodesulfobacteriota bacterium]|nr:tripartite tricarboxylate transporter TctB family protein [Thermodesulfobacteriota bacterium]
MERFDKIGSAVCLVIAAVAVWQSSIIPMGRISKPGPGFLPFYVGIILALLSAVLWVDAATRKASAAPARFLSGEGKWQYVILAGAALLAYTAAMETLGFRISTFILLVFLFRVVGRQKWWVVLAGSILVTSAAHLLFKVSLKVQLPAGLLRF